MRLRFPRIRRAREERGDTLLEVLFTVLVIAIAGVALLFGFAGSITGSSSHRNLVSGDVALRTVAESVYSQMQQQSSPLINLASYSCVSVGSTVQPPPNSWNAPTGYGATATLYAYWAASGWQYSGTPSCHQTTPEEFQVSLTQPQGPPLTTYVVVNAFTSSSSGLSITSIAPDVVASPSTKVTLVIYGTGFQPGITGAFSGTDITFNGTGSSTSPSPSNASLWNPSPSGTSIVATVDVASGVTNGTQVTLTVTNPDNSTAQGTVTISALPNIAQIDTGSTVTTDHSGDDDQSGNGTPSCTGPTLASLTTGTSQLTITGSNFQPGAVVLVSSPDVSFVSSGSPPTYFVVTPTKITATVSVAGNPTAGTYYVTVVNPGGSSFTSNKCSLVIANPPPTIQRVSSRSRGGDSPCKAEFYYNNDGVLTSSQATCYVQGSNFAPGSTVSINNTDSNPCGNVPSASNVQWQSSSLIQFTVNLPSGCGNPPSPLDGVKFPVTVVSGGQTVQVGSGVKIKIHSGD